LSDNITYIWRFDVKYTFKLGKIGITHLWVAIG
jgi:hypothetical protein